MDIGVSLQRNSLRNSLRHAAPRRRAALHRTVSSPSRAATYRKLAPAATRRKLQRAASSTTTRLKLRHNAARRAVAAGGARAPGARRAEPAGCRTHTRLSRRCQGGAGERTRKKKRVWRCKAAAHRTCRPRIPACTLVAACARTASRAHSSSTVLRAWATRTTNERRASTNSSFIHLCFQPKLMVLGRGWLITGSEHDLSKG
jgi:hypothetical protein